jgi:hypothetical protein
MDMALLIPEAAKLTISELVDVAIINFLTTGMRNKRKQKSKVITLKRRNRLSLSIQCLRQGS